MTAQGQITIPVEIRRRLGLAPVSVLEWLPQGDGFVVRKAGRHNSEEVHAALLGRSAPEEKVSVKQGIRKYVQRKHART
jgi:bifunctional DNA-binding transcriptional regulator/antitoxin component of YhaV-PrlF toxin-antitoxin module